MYDHQSPPWDQTWIILQQKNKEMWKGAETEQYSQAIGRRILPPLSLVVSPAKRKPPSCHHTPLPQDLTVTSRLSGSRCLSLPLHQKNLPPQISPSFFFFFLFSSFLSSSASHPLLPAIRRTSLPEPTSHQPPEKKEKRKKTKKLPSASQPQGGLQRGFHEK